MIANRRVEQQDRRVEANITFHGWGGGLLPRCGALPPPRPSSAGLFLPATPALMVLRCAPTR
jgi:hypothetical protein